MDIEEAFVAYLKAHTGLAALVSTRIYPDERTQSVATLPAVSYQLVSNVLLHTLTGQSKQESPVYQFTVYASSRSSAKAVAAQIKAALSDYVGTMGGLQVQKIELENELYGVDKSADGTVKINTADLEFTITYEKE